MSTLNLLYDCKLFCICIAFMSMEIRLNCSHTHVNNTAMVVQSVWCVYQACCGFVSSRIHYQNLWSKPVLLVHNTKFLHNRCPIRNIYGMFITRLYAEVIILSNLKTHPFYSTYHQKFWFTPVLFVHNNKFLHDCCPIGTIFGTLITGVYPEVMMLRNLKINASYSTYHCKARRILQR